MACSLERVVRLPAYRGGLWTAGKERREYRRGNEGTAAGKG